VQLWFCVPGTGCHGGNLQYKQNSIPTYQTTKLHKKFPLNVTLQ
jgi:hypothetical protein